MSAPDEFETIARLLRPLTREHPGALELLDDAAVIPSRPGYDLVVSKDAMVAGVHFLEDEAPETVARRLLRTNLSDLAAKGAEPFGYFLATAWPRAFGWAEREAFARGLALDGGIFELALLGGDTISTPGPLTVSATIMGWVPSGRMVRRSGARAGDRLLVSGTIGDGFLGLQAARGELDDAWLAGRYRLPEPRVGLSEALLEHASAAADVSDGLLADAGHIGEASGLGLRIELDALPLSGPARAWLGVQPDRQAALLTLASGGDDYEVVCAASGEAAERLMDEAEGAGAPMTEIGEIVLGGGVEATFEGRRVAVGKAGYRHG